MILIRFISESAVFLPTPERARSGVSKIETQSDGSEDSRDGAGNGYG